MRYPFFRSFNGFESEVVGYYELNQLPGNAQIIVSNHSQINPEYRGMGFGQALSEEKIALMEELGYDYSIATVRKENDAQMRIMEKNGWKVLDEFFNRESGQNIVIFGRRLRER